MLAAAVRSFLPCSQEFCWEPSSLFVSYIGVDLLLWREIGGLLDTIPTGGYGGCQDFA
jgi:hypothetical protein